MVDNNSTDDTIQEAGTCALELLTLRNSHNVGFARAVNQGARVAEGDLLVILNPDTIATAGSLDNLVDALRTDTVGASGGPLLGANRLPQKGFIVRRRPTIRSLPPEVFFDNTA